MRKILLIFIVLTLFVLPNSGICKNWISGYGYEADNFIKNIARKNGIPNEYIDEYFFYTVTVYSKNRTAILKVVDIDFGDEYYKNINNVSRKNNNIQNNSPNEVNPTEEQNLLQEQQNKEFEEFETRITAAVNSKNPSEIMKIANEMFEDYWWENFTLNNKKYSIEFTISNFLYNIDSLPNMYDIFTTVLTNLTYQELETPLVGEQEDFFDYIKSDKNVNIYDAIYFLEFLDNKITNMNFAEPTNDRKNSSHDQNKLIIKRLKELKR